jgi:hypothetical protein
MVKEKMHCNVNGVVEGGHGLIPLGEIIDFHEYVFVSIARWRGKSHEVYARFVKGACSNDWCRREGGALALLAYS